MYDYVARELVALLDLRVPQIDVQRLSICGHSMGGHGALVIGLREPRTFKVNNFMKILLISPKFSKKKTAKETNQKYQK